MALRVAEEALLQEKVLNAGPRTPHRGRGEQGLTMVFCPRHSESQDLMAAALWAHSALCSSIE